MALKSLYLSRCVLPRRGCVEGPRIAAYEQAFAQATGARYAVGFWKGRVAFFAALKALDIGEGDDVVLPGYTCMVVCAALRMLGARPVYVDIEPEYCTLDPDKLAGAITPRTRAIMIQHTYGWPSFGLQRVVDIARTRGLPIIEDCCHALGTWSGGRHVGNFGVGGFFSSQWSKPFTTGLGGMLVCNDHDVHERVCGLRDAQAEWPKKWSAAQLAVQGILYDLLVYPKTMALACHAYRWLSNRSIVCGSTSKSEYAGQPPHYFQRLCEVQAVAGLFELQRLERSLARRRQLVQWYAEQLAELGWPVPHWPVNAEVSLLRFPVRVRDKEAVLQAADRHLVELGDWFIRPLHSHLAPQEDFGYATGMCPQADRAAREIVNLPTHARVGTRHARRVIRFLREHCRPAPGAS